MKDKEAKYLEEGEKEGGSVPGLQIGRVSGIEDPQGLGRVKVTFPFRDADDDSHWARVATEMAGKKFGSWFLPEKDDEVLIGFENGDIHHPIVIGSLYTGKKKPPFKHDGGDNDHRGFKSRSGHKVVMNDKKNKQKVTVESQAGHKIEMKDKSGSEKVLIKGKSGNNTIELDSANGKVKINAQKEISMSAPTVKASAKKEVKLSSKAKVKIEGKAKVDISAKGQLNLKSSGLGKLKASGPLQIKGAIIQLN